MKARWCLAALLAGLMACDDGGSDPADAMTGGTGGEGAAGGEGGEGGEGGTPDMAVDDPDMEVEDPDMAVDDPDAAVEDPDAAVEDPDAAIEDPDMAAVEPDMALVESPIECDRVCTRLQTECPEAFAIHGNCDDCVELSDAYSAGPTPALEAAADVCVGAVESGDCRALYTCLVDPDGLHATGTGASVVIQGTIGVTPYDLAIEDAYAAVGLKNDGRPSDLELSFVSPDGRFLVLKFDDLAADIGEIGFGLLDASNNEVQLRLPGERFDLDTGLVEVVRFALPGGDEEAGFQVIAEVRENQEAMPVTIRVEGSFD